jgi:hypothetical protein
MEPNINRVAELWKAADEVSFEILKLLNAFRIFGYCSDLPLAACHLAAAFMASCRSTRTTI